MDIHTGMKPNKIKYDITRQATDDDKTRHRKIAVCKRDN
jgi:hypothetical protein